MFVHHLFCWFCYFVCFVVCSAQLISHVHLLMLYSGWRWYRYLITTFGYVCGQCPQGRRQPLVRRRSQVNDLRRLLPSWSSVSVTHTLCPFVFIAVVVMLKYEIHNLLLPYAQQEHSSQASQERLGLKEGLLGSACVHQVS